LGWSFVNFFKRRPIPAAKIIACIAYSFVQKCNIL
jgi:hypothetical protein